MLSPIFVNNPFFKNISLETHVFLGNQMRKKEKENKGIRYNPSRCLSIGKAYGNRSMNLSIRLK